MNNRVFTTGEVAGFCGVSSDTVSRWFDLGQIDGFRLGPGGDRRIPEDKLRTFMISRGIPLDRLDEGEKRVLLVDDDPFYLELVPSMLAEGGDYVLLSASTGFDAGAMVVEQNPHLVILDIHLSDMDGRMVCERIKRRQETRYTRILGISGFIPDEDIAELAHYGFDDFLRKPFDVDTLCARVERLLKMPQTRVKRPSPQPKE